MLYNQPLHEVDDDPGPPVIVGWHLEPQLGVEPGGGAGGQAGGQVGQGVPHHGKVALVLTLVAQRAFVFYILPVRLPSIILWI